MDNGIKVLLKVDPFREAISRHQDPSFALSKMGDELLALIVTDLAGHRLHRDVGEGLRQLFAKVVGKVVRGGNEAAVDDGPRTAANKVGEELGGLREFPVIFWT